MANRFNFSPNNGFKDSSAYPNPQNETESREQLQRPLDQLKDFINRELVPYVKEITSNDIKITETEDGKLLLEIIVSPEGVTKEYVDEQIDKVDERIGKVDAKFNDLGDQVTFALDGTTLNITSK
jgi:hypothetical protein